jgi:hypothetical protein
MISHTLRDRENYGNVDERKKNQGWKVKFTEKISPLLPQKNKEGWSLVRLFLSCENT